jgi:predicted TIM-barrel fold metal-dependent hydrolase
MDTATYPWQPTFGFVPTRDALPQDLLRSMDRHDVAHAVLVQPSAYGPDHRFLLETVRAQPTRFVAIGLVDPSDPADTSRAVQLVSAGACVGLRINLSLDLQQAARQASGIGWEQIEAIDAPLCLRATPDHRALVTGILSRHRQRLIMVDHLGLPDPAHLMEGADFLEELAGFDHCYLKVAGLARISQEAPPHRDTWPLLRTALKAFGRSRLAWGSDYPDGGLDRYDAAIRTIEALPFLRAVDRAQLMTQTSLELWGPPAA